MVAARLSAPDVAPQRGLTSPQGMPCEDVWGAHPNLGLAATGRTGRDVAGAGGFEPPHGGIKIRCLTTWLRPNSPAGAMHLRADAHNTGVRLAVQRHGCAHVGAQLQRKLGRPVGPGYRRSHRGSEGSRASGTYGVQPSQFWIGWVTGKPRSKPRRVRLRGARPPATSARHATPPPSGRWGIV